MPERDVRQEYVRQQSPVQARRFALLLITILLMQSALPGAPPATKVAAAATMAEPASSANGVPHATGRNAPLTQSEDHEPGVVVEPPPESDVAPFVAALPVPLFLRLESDQAILHPGERAQLTIHAWRATDEVLDELPLTLTLPPGLTLVDSTTPVTWPMATVTEGTIFSRTIAIEPADGNSFATAVVQVTLQTAAAERFSAYQVETVLGIDNRGAQPSGQGVNRATLGEEGLILTTQQGDITLLVEPNSAEVATTFRYDNLYQWQSTELPTEPPTEQISITTTARLTATASISTAAALTSALSLFLPIVRTGGEAVDDAPTEDNVYLVEDEIRFVRQWRLDADYQGAQRSTFAQRVHILVDADWLIERGQKPSRFTLYTRADTKASWQRVTDVRYDEVQQRFWASTTHFSEYGLGLDNRVVGESLPDVAAFGNDLFTGAATYSYPIAVPTGAGGMAPALGLHYSSATVDTFRWANYKNELPRGYRVQAGLAGLGWNISALNHIALTEEGDPHTSSDNRYSLVLNGTSNTFLQGQRLTEDFARIEDNRGQSVARGKWIITTADGTSHYFGGTTTGLSQPDAHPYENVMIWNTGQYTQHNVENKWFLRKSVDPLGNYVAYTYDAVTRTLPTCGNGWYDQAIRPATITWGGNEQRGLAPTMRVIFGYEARTDYKIEDWADACTQSIYSKERLKRIQVEVKSEGQWQPLREYRLGYGYSTGVVQHSLLQTITEYGYTPAGNPVELRTQRFGYVQYAIHSELYLKTVENGWGGQAVYNYATPTVWSCHIDGRIECDEKAYRRQLIAKTIYDGTTADPDGQPALYTEAQAQTARGGGNWLYSTYEYGQGIYRQYKNEPVEFLGYPSALVTTYAKNSNVEIINYRDYRFSRDGSHRVNEGEYTAEDAQIIAGNPDPRLGHSHYEAVMGAGSDNCPTNWVVDGHCLFALTQRVYSSWTGSDATWYITDDYTARPRWVRQDRVIHWVDGVSSDTKYRYAPEGQQGNQFGNVTWMQETVAGKRLVTLSDYFPNVAAHIVNLPARVRKFDILNSFDCLAESRFIYGAWYDARGYQTNVDKNFQSVPVNSLLVKQERALKQCPGLNEDANAFGGSVPLDIAPYAADWAITRYAYDAYGNQTTANYTGANSSDNLILATDYETIYHHFPVRRYNQNRPSHQENAFYYGVNRAGSAPYLTDDRAHWGALAEWCGVNEVCSRYGYDDFGRLRYQWDGVAQGADWQGQSATTATVQKAYRLAGDCGGMLGNSIIEWRAPRHEGNFNRQIYNGLGQLIQVQGPQAGWQGDATACAADSRRAEVDSNYAYDALGQQIRAGVPVATNANWVDRAANWAAGYTATTYDLLGRPLTVVAPNGESTSYKYVGRSTRVVAVGQGNESGTDRVVKWTESDGLGNLARISTWRRPWQAGDQPDATLYLTHDGLGNLRKVEQEVAGDRQTLATMSYDIGGRKVAMADADLGQWSYAYDRRDKLVRQSDGRAKTTCLYYDAFDRLAGKHFSSGTSCPPAAPSYQVSYAYDARHGTTFDDNPAQRPEIERSRGQLTQVTSADYSKELYYNAQGQLRRDRVTIAGAPQRYNSDYSYDQYLRLYATQYPDGEIVKVNFNSMGLPSLMCSAYWNSGKNAYWCDGNPWYVNNAGYDEAGRLTALQFPAGGNLWRTQSYRGWTATNSTYPGDGNGRLNEIRVGTTAGSSNRLLLVYDYDSFGNVKRITENGTANPFTYDEQNRVTAAYGKNYSYDTVGRMSSYEGTGQTVNNSFPLHAIKKSGYSYDANGNLVSRAGGQTLTWNHENQLSAISGGGLPTESYLYDDEGIRVKQTSNGVSTWYPSAIFESKRDTIWVDDSTPPAPTVIVNGEDGWNWTTSNPAPYSGSKAHVSANLAGIHQHYFYNAPVGSQVTPATGEALYAYIYLDPASPPSEVMVQWHDGSGWEHRAYWGANSINAGTNGSNSRRYMGPLPATGQWMRLEVPAAAVGLENVAVKGMAFTLYGGRAWWDKAGVANNTKYYSFNGQRVAMKRGGVLTYLHGDALGSTVLETNTSGNPTADQKYYAYGKQRDTGPVVTEHKFTGQKLDSTGLMYYQSRYYDPAIGAFISPDTIVPDANSVFDYNRYMMVRGNPLKYSDPSGHLSEDEVNSYFGFDSQEAMAEVWGENVAAQLWNTSFTWGDVLSYDGGDAMLTLFEDVDSGTFYGGFWGLTGKDRGTPVSSNALSGSSFVKPNGELAQDVAEGDYPIPNRLNANYRYDYYARTYVHYGLLTAVATAASPIQFGWELGHRFGWVAKAPNSNLSLFLGGVDAYLALGSIFESAGLGQLPMVDELTVKYPLMSPMQSFGLAPIHLSRSAPAGKYE